MLCFATLTQGQSIISLLCKARQRDLSGPTIAHINLIVGLYLKLSVQLVHVGLVI